MRKKRIIIVLGVSIVMSAVYMIMHSGEPFLLRTSNALFLIGMLNVLTAFLCHLRNGGVFRPLGYFSYKKYCASLRNKDIEGNSPQEDEEMSFLEYTEKKYSEKWDAIPFYICGFSMLLISLAILPILT